MKKIFLLLAILCAFPALIFAKMPHKLKNGAVVNAKHLNENFEYLEKSIKPGVSFDVSNDGALLGVSRIIDGDAWFTFNENFEPLRVNKSGVVQFDADFSSIVFDEEGCAGGRYIKFSDYPFPDDKFLISHERGKIYKNHFNNELYYYPPSVQDLIVKIPRSFFIKTVSGAYECQSLIPICTNGYRRNTATNDMTCDNGGLGISFYQEPWREATDDEVNTYLKKILIKLSPNDQSVTSVPDNLGSSNLSFKNINQAKLIEE